MFGIKEMDVDTLHSHIEDGKRIRLIDVRGIAEMAQGMIPNAEKLPLHTLPARMNEIDSDELTVLYCRSGARSAQGVGYMAQQGFDNVYNLRGGIIAWAQTGKPLEAWDKNLEYFYKKPVHSQVFFCPAKMKAGCKS